MINRRAKKMWKYIHPPLALLAGGLQAGSRGPLGGLEIVDFGSGYGDFMELSLKAGAGLVHGIDNNVTNLEIVDTRLAKAGVFPYRYNLLNVDLNSKRELNLLFQRSWHAGFCFSVLPYLDSPELLLYRMSIGVGIAFIECQYDGDGPGFSHIRDDIDMEKWLGRYWQSVRIIGRTELDIRDASRTIWLCGMPVDEEKS
jgi:hypothetical protein